MAGFRLQLSDSGYSLYETGSIRRPLRIDFTSRRLLHRLRQGGRELLAKAVAARPGLAVVDCTAGLGTDAFVLAARGCEVRMIERSHTLWLMLEDALERARSSREVGEIARRMQLLRGEARALLASLDDVPDVITIDPMFPPRRKSAEVKGELQLLQRFLGKDEDARSLVLAACATGCKRVVLKRPLTGGDITGLVPSHTIKGKASRFDVFVRG